MTEKKRGNDEKGQEMTKKNTRIMERKNGNDGNKERE